MILNYTGMYINVMRDEENNVALFSLASNSCKNKKKS